MLNTTISPDALSGLTTLALDASYRPVAYAGFLAIIAVILALDLGVFHRKARAVSTREAIHWTIVWVSVALLFNVLVFFLYENHWLGLGLEVPVLGQPGVTQTVTGREAAKLFFTGYLVEESLSLDNVFVIAVILASLKIPAIYQHRVLFWGIMGAVVMRGLMIFVGVSLVERFAWITYLFGGLLIFTAVKMAAVSESNQDPTAGLAYRLIKRIIPVSDKYDGQKFLTRLPDPDAPAGSNRPRLVATPLLVALILVEFTDLIFAVDSIPAIFAITADPFIVFTSNIFAILGLRSLYFCLAALIRHFRYVKPALVVVLLFVGVKMCLVHTPWKIPNDVSIYVILGMLSVGVVASLLNPPSREELESEILLDGNSGGDAPADTPPSEVNVPPDDGQSGH